MTPERVPVSCAGNWQLADPLRVFAVTVNSCIVYWAPAVCGVLCWGLWKSGMVRFGGCVGPSLLYHGLSSCSVQARFALKRVGSNRLPYIRRRILNPWTKRQVPLCSFFRRDEVIEVQDDFMTSIGSCEQDAVCGPKGQTHSMRSEMSLDYCLPCTSFKIAVTALDALLTFIDLFPESFVLLSLVQGFGCVCM